MNGDPRSEDLRQLVRSLDDLDAEYAAGDLEEADYETLRNDYTVRVADAVRAGRKRSNNMAVAAATSANEATGGPAGNPTSPIGKRLVVVGVILLFAIGAGWLLARSAGERGIGETLTGSIELSSRQRVLQCQELGMNEGLILEAVKCFDDVLISDPENVEALTYRAWFLVLTSTSGEQVSPDQRDELLNAAAVYLDQAIDIDTTYPDARAFRAVVADRQGNPDDVCSQIEVLTRLDPPPFFLQLTDPVAERNGCP